MKRIIKDLITLANDMDAAGLKKESDHLDLIIKSANLASDETGGDVLDLFSGRVLTQEELDEDDRVIEEIRSKLPDADNRELSQLLQREKQSQKAREVGSEDLTYWLYNEGAPEVSFHHTLAQSTQGPDGSKWVYNRNNKKEYFPLGHAMIMTIPENKLSPHAQMTKEEFENYSPLATAKSLIQIMDKEDLGEPLLNWMKDNNKNILSFLNPQDPQS